MRKIRSLIAAFLVVLIQITPGPLGLRKVFAYASTAPAAGEWAEYNGSNGCKLYMRSNSQNPTVDSSAKVSLPVDTGYKFKDKDTGAYKFVQSASGGIASVDLASGETKEFIKNNADGYPKLSAIQKAATPEGPWSDPGAVTSTNGSSLPAVGQVINVYYTSTSSTYLPPSSTPSVNVQKVKITSAWTKVHQCGPSPETMKNTLFIYGTVNTIVSDTDYCSSGYPQTKWSAGASVTTDPLTPIVGGDTLDPGKINQGLTQNGFPSNGPLKGELVGVAAGTGHGPAGGVKSEDLSTLQAQGFGGSVGDGEAAVTDVPPDDSKDDTSDSPYSPAPNGDPYPQDPTKIDFSKRMTDFFSSAKQSAIFSLPSSFADIPSGSSPLISIDAPGIFGHSLTFDFSSMDRLWAILRPVVLAGFSFIGIRIVCLKR